MRGGAGQESLVLDAHASLASGWSVDCAIEPSLAVSQGSGIAILVLVDGRTVVTGSSSMY
jgi:hypothetical protein